MERELKNSSLQSIIIFCTMLYFPNKAIFVCFIFMGIILESLFHGISTSWCKMLRIIVECNIYKDGKIRYFILVNPHH